MQNDRRDFLKTFLATSTAVIVNPHFAFAQDASSAAGKKLTKKIPSSGVDLPVIGLGTWITFNVGTSADLRSARTEVMKEFFAKGGKLIDSSPMYGSSEAVVGHALKKLGSTNLFSATKVWTSSKTEGLQQIKTSQELWGVKKFDLLQIHNLEGWQDHLKTLTQMKEKGELAHIGVTTSHGRRHDELEKIMLNHPIDFVQLTYNMIDREVEDRLLKTAIDRKIAVIANRPYQGGRLIERLKKKPLPKSAEAFDCHSWPEFLLKFTVSHPAVTCANPATTKVDHLRENMRAGVGRLPTMAQRQQMLKDLASV